METNGSVDTIKGLPHLAPSSSAAAEVKCQKSIKAPFANPMSVARLFPINAACCCGAARVCVFVGLILWTYTTHCSSSLASSDHLIYGSAGFPSFLGLTSEISRDYVLGTFFFLGFPFFFLLSFPYFRRENSYSASLPSLLRAKIVSVKLSEGNRRRLN